MGLFDERIAYKPFEYPDYYTEGWLKQAQAFWLHTEIPMQSDIKDWKEKLITSVCTPDPELEKIEAIDKKLLRYLTVRVKKFDLETNFFSKKDEFIFDEELMESFLSKILIEKGLENLTLLSDFKFKNLNTQLKEKKIHL